ncbi:hypothetical protein CSKR_204005 [Clonorchis sinensis]|uniref:Uncharacterized protein n=1 Tax=Clonorchis sinensis TaxID=79923 RepID=A0A8T1MTR9_CLOSI|nr:hypothetical protein CSKR_204005 [Clonorchis sinensis]
MASQHQQVVAFAARKIPQRPIVYNELANGMKDLTNWFALFGNSSKVVRNPNTSKRPDSSSQFMLREDLITTKSWARSSAEVVVVNQMWSVLVNGGTPFAAKSYISRHELISYKLLDRKVNISYEYGL